MIIWYWQRHKQLSLFHMERYRGGHSGQVRGSACLLSTQSLHWSASLLWLMPILINSCSMLHMHVCSDEWASVCVCVYVWVCVCVYVCVLRVCSLAACVYLGQSFCKQACIYAQEWLVRRPNRRSGGQHWAAMHTYIITLLDLKLTLKKEAPPGIATPYQLFILATTEGGGQIYKCSYFSLNHCPYLLWNR